MSVKEKSLLDKLDGVVPAGFARFDAFPKLPSTYKARSESRGFLTLFVILIAFLLVLNDLAEYVWGWPDYEFNVDSRTKNYMSVNVDMVVNTPCSFLSVDMRDVIGDRVFLTRGFHRDGTVFDIGQATTLKEHAKALSARQAISQSRKSRGFFSFFGSAQSEYRPTYNHKTDGDACRIYGTLGIRKVTANLHITTLGHGYSSSVHVPHDKMNLSHVITEFSFGPYFPDMVQPLDYSFELTTEPFVAYQYYLHVVPTTYVAPRSHPLHTNQYSVTHYVRNLDGHQGTPGIFFKFELDPMVITIYQRTTSLAQLLIRCVGVIGGVFTCASYFLRVTVRAVEAVSGADSAPGIVAAEATGAKRKWAGGQLRARPNANSGRVMRQGNGWVVEGAGTPYTTTPPTGGSGFGPASPYTYTPYMSTTPVAPPPVPLPPFTGAGGPLTPGTFGPGLGTVPSGPSTPAMGVGLGLGTPPFPSHPHSRTPSMMRTVSGESASSSSGTGGGGGMVNGHEHSYGHKPAGMPLSTSISSIPMVPPPPPPRPKSARKDD